MRIILVLTLLVSCTWLVGNLLLGALVAPTLFAHAPADLTRAMAGRLFGDMLMTWIGMVDISLWLALLLLVAIVAGYLLRLRRWPLLVLTLVVLVGLTGVHLMARSTAHEADGQRSTAFADPGVQILPDQPHVAFASLHKQSELLFAIETVLLALVVLATAMAMAAPPAVAAASEDKE